MGLIPSCGVCGRSLWGQHYKINGGNKKRLYSLCVECNEKFKMISQGKIPYPTNPEEIKKMIENGTDSDGVVKKRIRCNVCGEIFCYTNKDIERNRKLLREANTAGVQETLDLLAGNRIAANQEEAKSRNLKSQIVDYSKCPKCNSTELTEISEDEFNATGEDHTNKGSVMTSSADEIKKFKELLDSGIITQEEFDAKKKQLLGL